jgi:LysR family glycine cleavage system transcriptional activator
MKRGRLPLTAMRSFEAAGRLLSFSRAAEELFVSQAAISRQIRELENLIGKPLFERLHRRVVLTDAGRSLLDQLSVSFDDISARFAAIIAEPMTSLLRVSVEPSFAAALLIPRLNQFRALRPEIDVVVDASLQVSDFRNDGIELAIRYGAAATSWPRVESRHLFDVGLTPVLSPALLKTGAPLASPADLQRHTLLHDFNRDGWARWFEAAGLPEMAQQRGPIFPDSALIMQAAKLGHGVGLGDRFMEATDLAAGTLIRPFDIDAPYGAYWLVAPDLAALSPAATAFADWVVKEFGKDGR